MTKEQRVFGSAITIDLVDGLRQTVDFGIPGVPPLVVDEPPPLGVDAGPSPTRLLSASVGSCLSASLVFCFRKSQIDVESMRTTVRQSSGRNDKGRLRVQALEVLLEPVMAREFHERAQRCIGIFQEYCTVTASIRDAIDVTVEVRLRESGT